MRKKIIAGNWKMNKTPSEAVALVNELKLAGAEAISINDKRVLNMTEIVEVNGIDENVIKTTQIFKFEKHWIGEDGTVIGELLPTGNIPEFIKKMSSDVIEKYRRLFCSNESKELSNGKITETTGKQEK